MKAGTRYQVCVVLTPGGGIAHAEGAISLRHVDQVIDRLRKEHPTAHMIFVKQFSRGADGIEHHARTLHRLTVSGGTTADERRAAAAADLPATAHQFIGRINELDMSPLQVLQLAMKTRESAGEFPAAGGPE